MGSRGATAARARVAALALALALALGLARAAPAAAAALQQRRLLDAGRPGGPAHPGLVGTQALAPGVADGQPDYRHARPWCRVFSGPAAAGAPVEPLRPRRQAADEAALLVEEQLADGKLEALNARPGTLAASEIVVDEAFDVRSVEVRVTGLTHPRDLAKVRPPPSGLPRV